ncbi:MAG: response regulator [Kiritimatiellales bacterium]|nr:response regulator [Kiritimatiellota bacterium]MBL7012103.1 response regulator [Kiritimatiellales bacterium]
MRPKTITLKLLTLVIGGFIISSIAILLVANHQLVRIIDQSQNAMYAEKVDVIHNTLARVNERLQKTGLVEAYEADFKASVLQELRNTYYIQPDAQVYPFIIDPDGNIILHPDGPHSSDGTQTKSIVEQLQHASTSETPGAGIFQNRQTWYTFKSFDPWGWVVCYTVPLDVKYHDARIFQKTLIFVMSVISIIVLLGLSVMLTRHTKPIVQLANVASEIAGGNLDQEIPLDAKGEVGVLARNFKDMRDAIHRKISELNKEIDERRKTQHLLRRNEENLRTTLNSIGDAVIATDTAGLIVRMNPVAEKLTGWSAEEALGNPLDTVFKMRDIDTGAAMSFKQRQASPSDPGREEILLAARDDTTYRIADSWAPICSDAGELLGMVLIFRDVTSAVAMQEQLRQSQKMDAIGQLAGGIAHDFNNVLMGIMGATEILQDYLTDDPKAEQFHGMIMDSAQRAAGLTEKLLAFSRKQTAVATCFDLHKTLNDCVSLLDSTIDPLIQIRTTLTAPHSHIVGDPAQLQASFLNIGINASHAMPKGGTLLITTRNIELDAAACKASPFDLYPGSYLEVEFRDCGSGIDPTVLPHIFEPFYTTKAQGKGTGLGLAAAFGTVQQHHGAIFAHSQAGVGTEFYIQLPLALDHKDLPALPPDEMVRGDGRILFVDDESSIQTAAKLILEQLGYQITVAGNGREAVELFSANPTAYDLVVLDMVMPEMNGHDCFIAIRKINKEMRILLCSGFARGGDMEQMIEMGLNGYLQKPYRYAELSQEIARILQSEPPPATVPVK